MPIINLKKFKKIDPNNINRLLMAVMGLIIAVVTVSYNGKDIWSIIGMVIFIATIFMLSMMYFKMFYPNIFNDPKQLIVMKTILILMLVLMIIIIQTETLSGYLIPVSSAAILLTILLSPGIALLNVVIISLIAGVVGHLPLSSFFVFFAGGLAGIYSSRNVRKRNDLNKSGMYILMANVLSIGAVSLLAGNTPARIGINIGWGAGNALISVVIAGGLLPIFENIFSITTNIKLLELGDFNQPLLKRLMLEAPGTYHHSLMVGNLAENACERIGANTLLARVGAYYHDIGKLKNPHYFIENQMHSGDKHKNLKPNISTLILKRHVKDGLTLAEECNLDKVIKDMIAEHQGTTLIEYFYKKVLEGEKEESNIDKKEYRYPGPRPRTEEAGVLMLADAVEAACRTLEDPTYSRISGLVIKVINNKFIDNQLNNCDLTLASLEEIQKSFTQTLSGIYHSRIEYPEDKEESSVE
ncbi:HD family phosphohydrolase [Elusimicrobiota bacterium]